MSIYIRMMTMAALILLLSACGGGADASQQADYDQTKKMVVDILKTEDGQTALKEVLADEKMQTALALDSKVVEEAVNKALTSEEGKKFWTKLFSDPEFISGYTEVIKKEQEDLFKGLMKDPEFQKNMIEIYQNPEMMEQMTTVMKGQQFREHLETTIQETLNSPVFQAKMSDILLKAAEKMQAGSSSESGGEGESGQQQSGGSEGGGGGGGSQGESESGGGGGS
ncbi:spore germination lipoprotein GerD [Thalassobacillus sp. CUG 92003]|uniref:spore germination lipoprotein GerD n=1 Tax=Thalassobacillus sp. CUG 92003 TaxID=2736641 RepID=UPI0015E7C094|nr:spore germination lipoprotein GerD [Thalassobacillus sp. CUG 92003]